MTTIKRQRWLSQHATFEGYETAVREDAGVPAIAEGHRPQADGKLQCESCRQRFASHLMHRGLAPKATQARGWVCESCWLKRFGA